MPVPNEPEQLEHAEPIMDALLHQLLVCDPYQHNWSHMTTFNALHEFIDEQNTDVHAVRHLLSEASALHYIAFDELHKVLCASQSPMMSVDDSFLHASAVVFLSLLSQALLPLSRRELLDLPHLEEVVCEPLEHTNSVLDAFFDEWEPAWAVCPNNVLEHMGVILEGMGRSCAAEVFCDMMYLQMIMRQTDLREQLARQYLGRDPMVCRANVQRTCRDLWLLTTLILTWASYTSSRALTTPLMD